MPAYLGTSRTLTQYRMPPFQGAQLASLFDADAAAFIAAAGITDSTQKGAINSLVMAMKGASIWTPMLAIYPFVGATSTTCSYNLKNTAAFQITWGGLAHLTFDANGLTSDGATAAGGDTGLDAATITANSLAFGFYSRTSADVDVPEMGSFAGGGADAFQIYANAFGGTGFFDNQTNTGRASGSTTNGAGLFTSSRTAAAAHSGYRNATSIASTAGAQGTITSADFFICQRKNGEPSTTRNLAFAFISNGLTAQNVSDLYAAVQAYQTTLSRQV